MLSETTIPTSRPGVTQVVLQPGALSRSAPTESRWRGPLGAAVCIGGAAFLAAVGSESALSTASLLLMSVGGLIVALLMLPVFAVDAAPAAVVMALIAFFYLPALRDALDAGIPHNGIRVTQVGLTLATIALVIQIATGSGAAWLGTRTRWLRDLGNGALRPLVHNRVAGAFVLGFCGLFLSTALASIATGSWSFYAPGASGGRHHADASGGFRLELMYSGCALAACTIVGDRFRRSAALSMRGRWAWRVAAAFVLLLLFVLQSRRLLMAGMFLMVFPILPALFQGTTMVRRVRTLAAVLIAGALLATLLYGSSVWRSTHSKQGDDAATHIRNMADTSMSAREVVKSARGRLSYLAMDAGAMELMGRHVQYERLGDAFVGELAGNVPALLFPNKYQVPRVTCEALFHLDVSHGEDLPCTPVAEGALLGGWLGITIVLVAWAATLAMAQALYASGTDAGRTLSVFLIGPLCDIESSAFPIIRGLRAVIMSLVFLWPLVWLADVFLRRVADSIRRAA